MPHPTALAPALTVEHWTGGFGFSGVTGGLSIPWVPLADVKVHVQYKAADAPEWTGLAGPTTNDAGVYGIIEEGDRRVQDYGPSPRASPVRR